MRSRLTAGRADWSLLSESCGMVEPGFADRQDRSPPMHCDTVIIVTTGRLS